LRHIPLRVDNGNTSWLDRVLELLMAPGLRHLKPAVGFQSLDDFAAVHRTLTLGSRIHISYTLINDWNYHYEEAQ
jgi:hypothetical protein